MNLTTTVFGIAGTDAGHWLHWALALACLALLRSHVLLCRSVKDLSGRLGTIAGLVEFPEGPGDDGQGGTFVVGSVDPPPPQHPPAVRTDPDDVLRRWRERRAPLRTIQPGGFGR